ncbi:MAG: protein translocase subunit SecD [Bacilli bacterium]
MKKLVKPLIVVVTIILICVLCINPIFSNISYGIDLQGGFEILYKVEPLEEGDEITDEDLQNTYKAIINRIDTLGVSEPVITIEGNNLIRVQLPGVSNEQEARDRISTTAVLSFRDTNDNLLMTSDVLGKGGASAFYNKEKLRYNVELSISDTSKFYEVTKKISSMTDGNNLIVTWLDFNEEKDSYVNSKDNCGSSNTGCISAASVSEGLNTSKVTIDGNFTREEAELLAELINSGSLPTKLTEEATPKSVSASFGSEVIKKTALAGIISFVIIAFILIFKYRFSGFIGSISLLVYILLVFAIFNAVDGVLTLTGIAALILGIGMAVDSIIISNERVKDELSKGSKLLQAFKDGNKNSIGAIIDANITTLIAGIVMYIFGESSVRGFATMLIITIIITVFSTVILYRFILSLIVKSKYFNDKHICLFGKIKNKKQVDYVKIAKYPILISLTIIIFGVIFALVRGFNFGVDFTGGTNINLSSETDIDFKKVVEIVKDYDVRDYNYYMGSKTEGYIKLNDILSEKEELSVKDELSTLGIETSLSVISTLVTKNLTKNAIKSLIYSLIAIIIYIAIRFNINYAISGILMLVHDVLIIVSIFAIFGISVDFIIVASLLTIIGYSINDTIVVFDRIRENRSKLYRNKKKLTKEELKNLVNTSSIGTINRSIWTSITTIVCIITLLCVGLSDIYTFNIAILIGLIAGAISSLLIGPRFWMILEYRSMQKPEEDDDEIEELKIKGINS